MRMPLQMAHWESLPTIPVPALERPLGSLGARVVDADGVLAVSPRMAHRPALDVLVVEDLDELVLGLASLRVVIVVVWVNQDDTHLTLPVVSSLRRGPALSALVNGSTRITRSSHSLWHHP